MLKKHLVDEFHKYQSCGVKFNSNLLLLVLKRLSDDFSSIPNRSTMGDLKSEKFVTEHIIFKWVDHFMFAKGIVARVRSGRLLPCTRNPNFIKREVAFYLDVPAREFNEKRFDEDCVFNVDETHVFVSLNDGRALAMKKDSEVTYSNFVWEGMWVTIMVMVGDGSKPWFEISVIVFQKDCCSPHIKSINNKALCVCYRTGPNGKCMPEYSRSGLWRRRSCSLYL